ncbi:MAG TPA: O-antigen ligase family protein [Thermoleophilia bacterium]|nr:O-antigen ligase family protein [Thermoleophilia bacterium]
MAVLVGTLATVLTVWSLHVHPRPTAIGLGLVIVIAFVVASGRRLLSLPLSRALRLLALLVVLSALLGPAVALPQARGAFAFRVLVALLIVGCLTWLVLEQPRLRIAPLRLIALLAGWLAWLLVTLLWAPDKAAGFRYLALVALMVVVLAATAYWGTTRARLRTLALSLGIVYALMALVAAVESALGVHLPGSAREGTRIAGVATAFFHNSNNLGAYLAICMPFLLVGFSLTRRLGLKALAVLGLALGAYALVHTGSRAALVAIGFEMLLTVVVVFARGWVRHRRTGAIVAVILLAGLAFLAFNSSQSRLLSRFQLVNLGEQVEAGSGSGGTRVALLRAGWQVALDYDLAGVGPGNAENLVGQQPDRPGEQTNLHNWWMEVFVDGGLPGFIFYCLFFAGLLVTLWRIGRDSEDPLLRYLGTATAIAVAGYAIGSLGPSSAFSFSPMWVLFGLGLAVVLRAERSEEEQLQRRGLTRSGSEAAA